MGSNSATASSAMGAADSSAVTDRLGAEEQPAKEQSGRVERSPYLYPGLGERKPAGGEDVTLLTIGGVAVRGSWSDDGRYIGWAPLPGRDRRKEDLLASRAVK
jgi:hypothetical protein